MTFFKPVILAVVLATTLQSPANAWVLSLFPPTQYPPETSVPSPDAITSADTKATE